MNTFPTCANCGWSGTPRLFTFGRWCDPCAEAFMRGALSACALLCSVWFGAWLSGRVW